MAKHEKFNFTELSQLRSRAEELGTDLRFSEDLSILSRPVKVGKLTAPNAFAVLPMEGCDSNEDGSPSELARRRYRRFGAGGSGLIWWEACAVVPEGRANPLQMMITKENTKEFADALKESRDAAKEGMGEEFEAVHILQLTHSGRYSRPSGPKGQPIIAQHDPYLDPRVGISQDMPAVSDGYLDTLPQRYAEAAVCAKNAGFDGVDIKACHRYLMSELLAAFTRPGKYGGSFENRTRLLRDCIRAVRRAVGEDFIIACRFNVFDAHPYPYGFGCDKTDFWKFDPTEPKALAEMLCREGVGLLSNSAGNPYYIYPQVTRPFDTSSMGIPVPNEHPLESISRAFAFTRLIQESAGEVPVVGNAYTWLRQYIPYAGAANLADGSCSFVGLGRSSIAYPDAPVDVLSGRGMDPKKCCITCSRCTQIMRDQGKTGCVVRDPDIYLPLYRKARTEAEAREKGEAEK